MNDLSKFKKVALACDVIEPVNDVKVITTTLSTPECPMIKRELREHLKLITEILV